MGGGEIATAIIDGLKQIYKRWHEGYVILMSESDYPIKNSDYISNYLFDKGKDFIVARALSYHKNGKVVQGDEGNIIQEQEGTWDARGRIRIESYHFYVAPKKIAAIEPRAFNRYNLKAFVKVLVYKPAKIFKALHIWLTYPTRRHPDYIKPYGGDFWFILRCSTIGKVLSFCKEHPDYLEYSKDTHNVDEIIMPTLVANIIPENERESNTLRYILWPTGTNSPFEFGVNDIDKIKPAIEDKDRLFIRKIQNIEVGKAIDELI